MLAVEKTSTERTTAKSFRNTMCHEIGSSKAYATNTCKTSVLKMAACTQGLLNIVETISVMLLSDQVQMYKLTSDKQCRLNHGYTE